MRVAKREAIKVSRYAHAKQFKRMRRELENLRVRLGRVIRDVHRKIPQPDLAFSDLQSLCEPLTARPTTDRQEQAVQPARASVVCIRTGKAHKRYEFGQKVSVSTSNRGNWIVGVDRCEQNPYDGHTLAQAVSTIERTTGVGVTDVYVDKAYRGHDYTGAATVHIASTSTRTLSRGQ